MLIGIPKEINEGELRVALTPEVAEHLRKLGFDLAIETNAGAAANYSDEAYAKAGVEIVEDPRDLWHKADIIMKVRPPQPHPELGFYGIELLKEGQTLITLSIRPRTSTCSRNCRPKASRPWPWTRCRGFPGPRKWTP